MVKRIAILSLLLPLVAEAGMTLQNRETFENLGTLNAGSPGNLGTVTGSFVKHPVGPTAAGIGDPGWSALIASSADQYHFASVGSATTIGFVGAWFYFSTKNTDPSNRAIVLYVTDSTGGSGLNQVTEISVLNGAFQVISYNGSAAQPNLLSVPINTWIFLGISYQKGTTYTNQCYYKLVGGALTALGTNSVGNNFNNPFVNAGGGNRAGGGSARNIGRYGMFSVYSMASMADTAYPSDMTDPVVERHNWYVNPATGSDANTGLLGAPWQTVTKLNAELSNNGVLPVSSGLDTGDIVNIDNTTTPLDLSSNQLNIACSGVTISNTGPILAYSTIGSGGWSATTGTAHVYQTTDGSSMDLTGVVVWENDKWMTHPTGATLASVTNSLDTTAGSFYSDGVNVYIHPFGSTNPGSDGKTYTRSRNRNSGSSALIVTAPDVHVNGLDISKTCLARSSDSDPYNGYGIEWYSGAGGTNLISNFSVKYWSKHAVGRTASADNLRLDRVNGVYGAGTLYVGVGGQSADVDYVSSGTNNSFSYLNCVCLTNVGSINGYGTQDDSEPWWLDHGSVANFSAGSFNNINVCSKLAEQQVFTGTLGITNSTCSRVITLCSVSADRVTTTLGPIASNLAGSTTTCRNCMMIVNLTLGALQWSDVKGTLDVQGCTIDLRGNSSGTGHTLYQRNAACSLTFKNNLFLSKTGVDHVPFYQFAAADGVTCDYNIYILGTSQYVAYSFNDGSSTSHRTFAQWQSLGYDTHSVIADPKIGANHKPYAKTPCWTTGTELGPATDITGKLFQSRRTCGAYEFTIPEL